jgi:membrane protease YdiL (CAAX protease family)
MTLIVVVVGAAIYYYERKQRIAIRPYYFGMMFAESLLYAVMVGSLVAMFVGQIFGMLMLPALQTAGSESLTKTLVLSLGAGIYEELFFRLILVTGLYALLGLFPISNRAR